MTVMTEIVNDYSGSGVESEVERPRKRLASL